MDDEVLMNFFAITETSDPAIAANYLATADYDLSQAVALYFAAQGGSGSTTAASSSSRKPDGYYDEEGIRKPDEIKRGKLIDESEIAFVEMAYDTRYNQHHKSRKDKSVFHTGGYVDPQSLSGKEKTLATMFRPPTEIMTNRSFDECLELGKEEDRWVIANIQKDSEFTSHLLNRDLWADENVQDMVKFNFIFWQQLDISGEASKYCTRYKVNQFPHIAIVNPRTGALVWKKEGDAIKVNLLAQQFQDFLGNGPSPKQSNPASLLKFTNKNNAFTVRPPLPPDLESEEDAIAKAIALSLEKPISKDIIDISKSENSPVTVKPTASTPSQKPFTGFTAELLHKISGDLTTPESTSSGVISIKVKVQNSDGGQGSVFLLRLSDDVTVGRFLLQTHEKLLSPDKKFDVFFGHPQQKFSENLKFETDFLAFAEKRLTELGVLSNSMVIVRLM